MSEIFVLRTIHVKIVKEFIIEAVMTVGFILCASFLNLWIGCAVYGGMLLVYAIINYKSIIALIRRLVRRKSSDTVASKEAVACPKNENSSEEQPENTTEDGIEEEK